MDLDSILLRVVGSLLAAGIIGSVAMFFKQGNRLTKIESSVQALKESHRKVEKKVDSMSDTLNTMNTNLAVLAAKLGKE